MTVAVMASCPPVGESLARSAESVALWAAAQAVVMRPKRAMRRRFMMQDAVRVKVKVRVKVSVRG
jgi:hypothetical protein